MKIRRTIIAATVAALMSSGVLAQNFGFESGNTTGWTSSSLTATGSQTVQAGSNNWVINPYGSYMGTLQIQSGSFSSMTSSLGLNSTSVSGITTLLQQQAQSGGGGNPTPTTAGWTTRTATLTAGTQFSLAWQYVSVDYVPFNDGSIASLTKTGSTGTTVVNNYNSQYALLGFTNPGTGDYSTGSYGATGWQTATFNVTESGDYLLGFGVFNLGDTALSPILYVDEVQGTTTKNGTTFGAVAPNNDTAPSATPPSTPSTPTAVGSPVAGAIVVSSIVLGQTTTSSATNYSPWEFTSSNVGYASEKPNKIVNLTKTTTTNFERTETIVETTTTPRTQVTTTTPTSSQSYSDGSTVVTNGTATTTQTAIDPLTQTAITVNEQERTDVENKNYQTRGDQIEYLAKQSALQDLQLLSNPLDRHTIAGPTIQSKGTAAGDNDKGYTYLIVEGVKSNTSDTYQMNTSRFGVGHEKNIASNWLVGAQFNNMRSNMSGWNSGGGLEKNHLGVYSLATWEDWILKSDIGVSFNKYNNWHSIPELEAANTGNTKNTTYWISNRLYTPAFNGFRPYVGVRTIRNTGFGFTETANNLPAAYTAISYNSPSSTTTTAEAGLRYENKIADKVNVFAEIGKPYSDVTTVNVGAGFSPEKNVFGNVSIAQQRLSSSGIVNNMIQAAVKWVF